MNRGQDEVAEVGNVGDVAQKAALLGVAVHALVHVALRGRGDHEERAAKIAAAIRAAPPRHRERAKALVERRRHDGDVGAAREQHARLLGADRPTADHDAAAPVQIEAGHVVLLAHNGGFCTSLSSAYVWTSASTTSFPCRIAALIAVNSCHLSGTASAGVIASTGHSGSHAPQSMHSSGSMTSIRAVSMMQSTGQTSMHVLSLMSMHGSAIT